MAGVVPLPTPLGVESHTPAAAKDAAVLHNAANAAHLDSSGALRVYVGSTMKSSLTTPTARAFGRDDQRDLDSLSASRAEVRATLDSPRSFALLDGPDQLLAGRVKRGQPAPRCLGIRSGNDD